MMQIRLISALISSLLVAALLMHSDDAAAKKKKREQTLPFPLAQVMASAQTVPVMMPGDAADDPAIWVNPHAPTKSLILGTDKKAGIYVYDLQGQVKQFRGDGRLNNVDLRTGFSLGGRRITLVTASNRSNQTIAIYELDGEKGELLDIADGPQATGMNDPYGLCMYQSNKTGHTYVFINGDITVKRQWRLADAGNGRVRAELVRELKFDSKTEGCVADDDTGTLYISEEDVALWALSAEPDAQDERIAIDKIADNPALAADLEGIALYDLGEGRGYIVVSSQGNSTYAVYRRDGAREYLGSFVIVDNPERGIDGTSKTDGIEITSANLGPGYEAGIMVVQDDRNTMPKANQNYKIVAWSAIADALNLESRREP